ncbi:uncharacterized protein HKW66_Vig0162180 [Vigna angularis]|uniref:Uncharacterized protein n=1 Tax=Phaseolus angularis TaxID=3914 RepID=A0A8T0JI40_PHAAN|nr:uncharacterized protein HKW66_Vig0162180 [Vigna angularis]
MGPIPSFIHLYFLLFNDGTTQEEVYSTNSDVESRRATPLGRCRTHFTSSVARHLRGSPRSLFPATSAVFISGENPGIATNFTVAPVPGFVRRRMKKEGKADGGGSGALMHEGGCKGVSEK